jgi:hypothetical protein
LERASAACSCIPSAGGCSVAPEERHRGSTRSCRLRSDPGAENALEIVVAFSTEDDTAAVKSDLIKAVHAALDTEPGKPAAR